MVNLSLTYSGPEFTILVNFGEKTLMSEKVPRRLSVSLPEGHYAALQRLAKQKNVSVSWVIRDAVRAYVEADSPLYNEIQRSSDDYVRAR